MEINVRLFDDEGLGKGVVKAGMKTLNVTGKILAVAAIPVTAKLQEISRQNDLLGQKNRLHSLYRSSTRWNIHAAEDTARLRTVVGTGEGQVSPDVFISIMVNEYGEKEADVRKKLGLKP